MTPPTPHARTVALDPSLAETGYAGLDVATR